MMDRRRGLKKPLIFLIGVMVGVAIWRWRYVVNIPIWLYRAHFADYTDLYKGTTNGLSNQSLVQTAREYVKQFTQVEVSGKPENAVRMQAAGISLNAKWFASHHPETVDFDPFTPPKAGHFGVTWIYAPGCQRVVKRIPAQPGPDWYDLKGDPCYGTYAVSVWMSPQLKPISIKIVPIVG